jgi:hypothetical protein
MLSNKFMGIWLLTQHNVRIGRIVIHAGVECSFIRTGKRIPDGIIPFNPLA